MYLFPRAEEVGGIGSSHVADAHSDWLARFDRCISFDRKGTHSVISHQGGTRCCSDTFADALSVALSGEDYFFAPDDGGVFTDSKNFIDHIPECTNVSIGYMHEHTDKEELDLTFLFSMRDTCVGLDWEALPTARDPAVRESLYDEGWYGSWWKNDYKKSAASNVVDYYTGGEVDIKYIAEPVDFNCMSSVEIIDHLYASGNTALFDFVEQADKYSIMDVIFELMYEKDMYESAKEDSKWIR
jgi:hypothetical protein